MANKIVLKMAHSLAVITLIVATLMAAAQNQNGDVRGTITDPAGALIPSARVVLSDANGGSKTAESGRDGAFHLSAVPPGKYVLVVTAKGFAEARVEDVKVFPGKTVAQDVQLQIPVEEQQVQVTDSTLGVSTSSDNNASSIVITGKDLDAL